jgi:hypothetical protein
MRPLMAHCHLGLGRLYRRTGDGTKGDELLATAIRMYREMEMGFWLEQAEAALEHPELRVSPYALDSLLVTSGRQPRAAKPTHPVAPREGRERSLPPTPCGSW